jgi:hypothetical protein
MIQSAPSQTVPAHGAPGAVPFLWLAPLPEGAPPAPIPAQSRASLESFLAPQIGRLVQSLVAASIEPKTALSAPRRQPVSFAVLNRRRRAARAWLESICAARTDPTTLHAVAWNWLPLLAGSGPELHARARTGHDLIERLRGLAAALIFDEPADNLLPQAHALHALESTLGAHLGAWQHATERSRARARS